MTGHMKNNPFMRHAAYASARVFWLATRPDGELKQQWGTFMQSKAGGGKMGPGEARWPGAFSFPKILDDAATAVAAKAAAAEEASKSKL